MILEASHSYTHDPFALGATLFESLRERDKGTLTELKQSQGLIYSVDFLLDLQASNVYVFHIKQSIINDHINQTIALSGLKSWGF